MKSNTKPLCVKCTNVSIYKCPRCLVPYCSKDCCQKHESEDNCKRNNGTSNNQQSKTTINEDQIKLITTLNEMEEQRLQILSRLGEIGVSVDTSDLVTFHPPVVESSVENYSNNLKAEKNINGENLSDSNDAGNDSKLLSEDAKMTISSSAEIRLLLKSKRLREYIRVVEASKNKQKTLKKFRSNYPEFDEFSVKLLNIVEGKSNSLK
eukprot:gene5118-7130_t